MSTGRSARTLRRRGRLIGSFARDAAGVSAIEFALVAPMIFFSLLAMVDVGFALRDRMQLDHVLRSGAQVAMRDGGKDAVLLTLKRSVCGGVAADCAALADIAFVPEPAPYCICPTTGAKDTGCTATCAVRPQKFYELSAARTYEGIFLPDMDLAPSVLVEVR